MTGPENTQAASAHKNGIFVNVFGRTDIGLVREHNEDNFLVADLTTGNRSIRPEVREHSVGDKGSLFAVCDGMGGAAAGEVASRIAVDTIYEMMQAEGPPEDDEDLARRLEAAIIQAGKRIFTAAKEDRKQRGMGTTVTAAVMTGPRLIIGQVGDSRAYILRKGKLIQVTKDQSLVQQLIDAKQLTEEEAKNFEKSNIILQALGTAQEIQVDMTSAVLRRNDALIMCSDGLSGIVDSEVITAAAQGTQDPMEACRALTNLACDGGGQDNITVVVARFDGDDLMEPDEEEDLVYRKFRYSPSAETTVRSQNLLFLDKKEEESKEPTQGIKIPAKKEDVEAPRPSHPEGRVQTGLFAAAGIALLVGIAFVAFTLSSQEKGKDAGQGGAAVPVNQSPTEPVLPSDKEDQNIDNGAPREKENEGEPVLSPTPEEMISGTGEPAREPTHDEPKDVGRVTKKETEKSGRASEAQKPEAATKNEALVPKPIDDNPF
jgi:serine/threonine protein phosphatase PrpC